MRLIVTSILVAVVMFFAYNAALKFVPPRLKYGDKSASQSEVNTIRAQSYLYGGRTPQVVVVGSSIGARLRDLPADWSNLSFAGDSAFTGLEILKRSPKTPRVVLIETNTLSLGADQRQLDSLFYPGMTKLRAKLPALQETSKPQHVLVRALLPDEKPAAKSNTPAGADPQQFQQLVTRRIEELREPLAADKLDKIVAQLRTHVKDLRRRGMTVVLFEMPELAVAMDQPLKLSLRERLHQAFPASQSLWVPSADASEFTTTDAVHLTPDSAARYSRLMKETISNLSATASSADLAQTNP